MTRYAESTGVPVEKTRIEIEKTLTRYGADAFFYGWDEKTARIQFRANGRHIRFDLPLPDKTSLELVTTPTGRTRTLLQIEAVIEAERRRRWRALLMIIKAKLEAVESGIVTFDDEFIYATVLPDNTTVGEWLKPQLKLAYESGQVPKMLPGPAR